MSISIIDKATQKQLSVVGQEVSLHGPSVIRLTGKRSELHQVVREGDSLNLTLASGAVIKVHGFFPAQGPQQNQLVLQDGKQLLQMESVDDGLVSARFVPIDSIDPLLVYAHFDLSTLAWIVGGLALAGAGAAALAGRNASSNKHPAAQGPEPLAAPVFSVEGNADGGLTVAGTAPAGSTVRVTYPDGSSSSVLVGSDGHFSVTSGPNQPSGPVSAQSTDSSGQSSTSATTGYVDTSAPQPPTQTVSANPDGTLTVTGTAEPGSTVKVTYADGSSSTVVADATGHYSTSSSTVQSSGNVSVTATDVSGNTSTATTSVFTDTVAPQPATETVTANPNGTLTVTGHAEPGSTVVVTYPDGSSSTVVADASGHYSASSSTVQGDGSVTTTSTDAAGNTSTATTGTYTDTSAPQSPTQTFTANPDGTLTVTGTAEPGSAVTVTYADGSSSSVVADAAGHYSTSSSTVQGSGSVSVTATDAAGNSSTATTSTYVDTTAPQAPSQTLTTHPDGTLTVSGSAEPGSTVTVTYADGSSSTVVADATGHYSTGSSTVQTSGTVSVTATDAAGNTSAADASTYADTTAPQAPIESVSSNPDGTLTVSGTGEPDSTINVTYPDGTSGTALVDASGHYSTTSSTPQSSGNVSVSATDVAGNTSATDVSTYTDTNAPQVPTQTIAANPDGTLAVTGTAEPGSTVTVTYADGSSSTVVADTSGHYSTGSSTVQGSGSVSVTATDAAGNASGPSTSVYTDTSAPQSPAETVTANPDGTLTVSGTAEPGSTVTITYADGSTSTVVADASGHYSTGSSTAQSSGSVSATATDVAGNTSAATTSVYTDTTAPQSPTQTITANPDGTLAITGTAEPGSRVTVTYADGSSSSVVADTSGHYSTSSSTVQSSGGVSVIATDAAGNASAPSTGVYTDTNAPQMPSQTITAQPDGTLTVSGSAEPGSTVMVTYADGSSSTVVVDASGHYSTGSSTVQTSGAVSVTATDAAGNTSAAAVSTYTDTTAPQAPSEGVSSNPDGTLTVSGTAEAGSTVSVTYPDGTSGTALVDATGHYSATSTTAQSSGNVSVSATDVAGNTSPPTTSAYTDTTAPQAPSQTLTTHPDGTLTVAGSGEPGSTINVTYPDGTSGTALVDASGHYSTSSSTVQTSGTVSVTATDAAGNTSAANASSYIDTTAPLAPGESISSNPDGTLTVSGTAEPGSTVSVTYPDGTSGTALVDATGHYSTTSGTPQTSGSVAVSATDAAGNTSASTTSGYIDTAPPLAPSQSVSANPDGTLSVSGTAEAGSSVTITYPDGSTSTALVDGTGHYTTTSGTPQISGSLSAIATDAAGNSSASTSAPYVDTLLPTATAAISAVTSDTGSSTSDYLTSDSSLVVSATLTGTLNPGLGDKVQISLDGGATWHDAALVSGSTFAFDNTASALADGSYLFEARVINAAGNPSPAGTQAVVIDTSTPSASETISLDAITTDSGASSSDFITSDNTLVLNGTLGTALAAGEGVRISLDGGATWHDAAVSGTAWSYDNTSNTLADGIYAVQVQVIDTAGNIGQSASQNVQIDSTPPVASETISIDAITTDTGASSSDFITGDNTLVLSGSLGTALAAGEGVYLSLDNGVTWHAAAVSGTQWSYDNSAIAVPDGTYHLLVQVVDSAGNLGQSASQTVVVDTQAPAASETVSIAGIFLDTGISASDFITSDHGLFYFGNLATALPSGEGVQLSVDGGVTWNDATLSGASWSYDGIGQPLPDGTYTIELRVIDSAGNIGQTASQPLVIDSSAPAASETIAIASITSDTGSSSSDFITGDNTLIFSGTLGTALAVDEGVRISLDGGTSWQVATVSGTNWSYDNSASTLADGTYTVQVQVVDTAGNIGQSASQALVIDTTPPASSETVTIISIVTDTGASASDFITSDSSLVFNGGLGAALSPDESVRISLDGGVTWHAAAVSGTAWSFDNSANTLADGTYNVQVQVIDSAGNIGQRASQNVLIDSTPPAAGETITIASISSDSGSSSSDFITNDSTLLFNGNLGSSLAAGEGVRLSLDGGSTWHDATVSGNSWSYDNTANNLADGTYSVQVQVIDTAGNIGQTASQSLVVDTRAPLASETITLASITTDSGISNSDFITSDNSLVFNGNLGTALAVGEGVRISLDGGATWQSASVSGTQWSFDNSANALADGTYSVQVQVIDSAGNLGQSASQSVVIDSTAPLAGETLSIDSIARDTGASASDFITSDHTLLYRGSLGLTLPNGEGVQLSTDGGATWHDAQVSGTSWSYDGTGQSLPDGNYTVQVRVIDLAGNIGQSASQALVIDSSAPSASETVLITAINSDTGASATDFNTSDPTLVFNGSLGAPLASNESVQISLDNGVTWVTANTSGSTWSYDNSANTLADGTYAVQVQVIDTAGNIGQITSQTLVVDTTPPAASESISILAITRDSGDNGNDFITNDHLLLFNGSLGAPLTAGEGVRISLDGGVSWSSATVSGTNWSYDNTAQNLADGSYSIQVQVIDSAGNIGQSASQLVQIDSLAPTATASITAISGDTGSSASDFITADNTLVINAHLNGTLASNEQVQISLDGGSTWQTASLVSGSTYALDNSSQVLSDGTYQFAARVTDLAGNTSPLASQTVVIDTGAPLTGNSVSISSYTDDVAPQVGNFGDGSSTNDTTPLLNGTVSGLNSGDSVQIYQGATLLGNATVTGGVWTYGLPTLAQGSYSLHAAISDAAGNLGTQSSSFSLTVDTSAPTQGLVIGSISSDTGASASDFITDDNTLLISGTLSAPLGVGETVQLALNGGLNPATATVVGTTWSLDLTGTALADGTYHAQAWVLDAAGNKGPVSSQDVLIDTSVPTASISIDTVSQDTGLSASDFITNDPTLVLGGTLGSALGSGESVQISLDGGSTWLAASSSGTQWSYDNTGNVLADGNHALQARVIDLAGNVGSLASQTLVVDTTPPTSGNSLAIVSYTDNVAPQVGSFGDGTFTNDSTPLLNGTVSGLNSGDSVQVYQGSTLLGTASISAGTWTYQLSGLTEGSTTYHAVIVDSAGNLGTASGNFSLTLDTTAPSASETLAITAISGDTGSSGSDFVTSDNTLLISGSLGTPLASGEGVQLSLDGGSTWFNASVSGSSWSYDNSASTLADGSYTLQARVVDAAGNVGQVANHNLVVDTTAPTALVSIDSISQDSGISGNDFQTNDSTLMFFGTLSTNLPTGESVQISLDGGSTWHATEVNGAGWTYDNTANVLPDDTYTVFVRVIDAAGNVGSLAAQTVVIDSSAASGNLIEILTISNDSGLSNQDFVTNDPTLIISGDLGSPLAANQHVEVSLDGGTSWHTGTSLGTSWSYDNTAQTLADGSYAMQARIIDDFGNVEQTTSDTLRIDTTAPAASETLAITSVSSDTGSSASDFITSDHTLVFSGTLGTALAAGEGVQLSLDGGGTWVSTSVSGTGWSYDNSGNAMADGSYTLLARVVDTAGNIGQEASQNLLIDSSAPSATSSISAISHDSGSSATDFITNDSTLLVDATLSGTLGVGESLQISIDGGATWHNSGLLSGSTYEYDATGTSLTDGSYSFQTRVVDAAGNIGAISSQNVVIDTTAPSATASISAITSDTGSSSSDYLTSDHTLLINANLSGTLGSGDQLQISTDNGSTWHTASLLSGNTYRYDNSGVSLADGSYSFQARVVDAAGNPGTSSSQAVVIDSTAPVESITLNSLSPDTGVSGSDFITSANRLNFGGTLGSALASGEGVQLSLDGGSTWVGATVSGSTWSYDNSASVLADGSYTVQARIIDSAGNSSVPVSHGLQIDTSAPSATATVTAISNDSGSSASDFITNDNTLLVNATLNGSLGSGESLQISLDNGSTWHTASLVSGSTYQYDNSASVLVDGSYSFQARVLDTAGNPGLSNAQVVVIDTSAPTSGNSVAISNYTDNVLQQIGNFGSGSSTNDTTPQLNGVVSGLQAGDLVQIYQGATLLGNASVSGSTWSYQLGTLAEGAYSYTAAITDSAGNKGTTSGSFALVVDTTAPTASETISIVAVSSDTGTSGDFITSDNTLVLSGTLGSTLASGDIAQVSLDGGSTWLNTTVSGSTWSYDNSASVLADGVYNLKARVVDGAGNQGATANQVLVVDTTAPTETIAIVSINQDTGTSSSDFNTSDTTLVFSGTLGAALGSGESVRISLDGGSTWRTALVSGNTWSYDNSASSLASGSYSVIAQVIDSAGNLGNSASQTIIVDTVAPTASTSIVSITNDTGASASDFITRDNTLVFQGTLSAPLAAGEGVQFSIDGGSTYLVASVSGITWSYDYTGSALPDGNYNIKVRVFDTAGNIGLTANQTLVIDTSAPAQSILITSVSPDSGTSSSDFVTASHSLVFSGSLGAVLGANESVQISLDGGSTWQAASTTGTNWTFNNSANSMADGTYSVQARVIDAAGNIGNLATQSLVIDSVAPTATATISAISQDAGTSASDFITNDQTLLVNATLSGTLGSGEALQISLNGGSTWQNATLVSGTTYQLDNTGNTLAAGSYTFEARVVDSAGNASSAGTQAVLISTTGPAVTALAVSSVSTDTNSALAAGTASTTNSGTNSDLVTRDTSLTVSGTYSGTLLASDVLQISSDGGSTWNSTTVNTGTHTWSYLDPISHASSVTYQLRSFNLAGNIGSVTASQLVTVDTVAPVQSLLAPALGSAYDSGVPGDHVTTNTSMTFTSAQSHTGSAGDTVLLVNDVNNDGVYSEGIDSLIGSATVAADGSWSLSASGLATGSYHLALMQVDAAGNRSRLSATTEVDVVSANDHAPLANTGWGGANTAGDTENKGTAYTLGTNGLWEFYSNLSVYNSTGLTSYSATSLASGTTATSVNNVTFVDYNRDGFMDVLGVDFNYTDGQQSWTYNGSSYTAFQISGASGGVYDGHGTVVAYDKTGDGYIDLAYGDSSLPGDANASGGIDSQLLVNNAGVLIKDSNFVQTPATGGASSTTGQPYSQLSGVDINNNGTVDLVFHQNNPAYASNNTLVVLSNSGTGSLSVTATLAGVFASPVENSQTISMTWADFNGDGYMDLYLNSGLIGSDGTTATANESRLYFNNQAGSLSASPLGFGDNLNGGASLAVDWNHDGAMDVIELPNIGAASSSINLYTNNGSGTAFATSILATAISNVSGAVAADYNWDGAVDLLYFSTGNTSARWIQNTNVVQYGTSLHLRLLDANGLTAYYGNTVQLYDSSGKLVGTQMINPQSGSNTNDSSSIVNFYGLSASQTYTLVLLRNLGGVSADVGGLASEGGNSIESVNASWTGLVAGAATSAYVLSAETGSNNANGNFVGTGYNDTFFATAGTDSYNGSGGWSNGRFGTPVWSATGGEDVVDFMLAGSTAINVNLNTLTAQGTGFNTATFTSIEGLRGGSGNDTFTASTTALVNNLFEGRGGNDSFVLGSTGGHATLVYNLLNSGNATGGNGSDLASGFVVGNLVSSATADVIDLSGLLSGYTGTAYVYKDAISGKFVLDAASQALNNYLSVSNDGSNSYVSVDLTGSGTFGASNILLTLSGVVTDLATLLGNDQLLLASSSAGASVGVNTQSILDSTPIISGTIPYALASGMHLEVMLNGVTYSSATGAVVVDPTNNTWYVQVPNANALTSGTYEVVAAIFNSDGSVAVQDHSTNELTVLSPPTGTTTVTGETSNISAMGMAVGDVNNDGLFDYFNATSIYTQLASNGSNINNFRGTLLYTEGSGTGQLGKVSSVQLLDINRSGNLSVMTEQANTSQGNNDFINNGNGASYTLLNYSYGTLISWGGQVGIDLNNDGYIDLVSGDKYTDNSGVYELNNKNGTFTSYDLGSTSDPLSGSTSNGNINEDIGAFDLNGDGRVDLLGQFWGGFGGAVTNLTVLLTSSNGLVSALAASTAAGTLKTITNVLYHVNASAGNTSSYPPGTQSMDVADFNGDGKLDLFLGQTSTAGTASSVYTSDGAGNFTLATTLSSSTLAGGVTLNTDWNGDGKLDVFEFQDNLTDSTTLKLQTSYEYWQNTTASIGAAPTFSRTLLSVSSVATATSITGAVAADFNYDGSQDLLINANGQDVLVVNPNVIAAGTSLHLKIEDPAGHNTYVSQTVNLYDSSGTLVETRILNGQYGYGTTDDRGIVDFYGLNPAMTYTAVLVKAAIVGIDGGEGSVTGVAGLGGGTTVNSTWTGLTPGAATHAYVLTADASTDSTTGTFVGSGYDDTFFAGPGTNTYSGSGGWETIAGTPVWNSTLGTDIVDYKLAGSTALTIDLSNAAAQNTGFNTATFKNIEGLAGGSGNDTFTDSGSDNTFEGRGGNDTFNLTHGGHDTLLYNVLAGASANNTGGNGSDIVNGFKVGTWEGTAGTQRLDVHALLVGYSGDGSASYQGGVATLGAGAGNIGNYLQVTQSGANTVISIDRDGSASTYSSATLATLQNVHTDLATLLANHQLTVV
ncbi:Ig-like domain repeat protein [Pseudomonas sp. TH07]|uniref:Ig-like domain-containing protein n=1 Tax=Pseudomonas sp. TH07 TaxID=2796373 RepID=UPI00191361F6|nr:Ig-like domain repeat protein [Pseudomonas sp. TH07]